MKIYTHNCYSCGNGYKGVNKLPSICTECKKLIIKWYEVIRFIDKEGFHPNNFLTTVGLKR